MTAPTSTFIQDILDLQVPQTVTLSADGSRLVYAAALDWQQKKGDNHLSTLWSAEPGRPHSARQLTSGFFNDHAPALAPDGHTLAFLSDRAKPGEASDLYALSLAGPGEPYPLSTPDPDTPVAAFKWSPDGKSIAFLSPDPKSEERKARERDKDDAVVYGRHWRFDRLRLLHVATGRLRTVIARDEHVADLASSDDGARIAFSTLKTTEVECPFVHGTAVYSVAVDGSDLKQVFRFPSQVGCLTYSASALYFVGGVTPDSAITANTIYKVDLERMDRQPVYVKIAHGDDDCAASIKKVRGGLVARVSHGLEDQIRVVNGETILSIPNAIWAWDAAGPQDSDDMTVAVVKSDISHPFEVYTTSSSGGGDLVKLSNHGAAFDGEELATCTLLSCKSLDGEDNLDGLFFTPASAAKTSAGTPATPLPTVLSIHGGPYYRVTDSFNPSYFYTVNALLHAGHAVLAPNYRGGNGHGEAYAAHARGGVGRRDHDDILALTDHCVAAGHADPARLAVSGWSQGGFLSYLCAVRNASIPFPWRFRAAIPGAGVSDWDSLAMTSDLGVVEAQHAGAAPWAADPTDVRPRAASALWELKKAVDAGPLPPLLMLHGERDARVPIEQATGFRRGLDHYGFEYEYVVYPREGHIIQERRHLEDMLQRVVRFCDQHLA